MIEHKRAFHGQRERYHYDQELAGFAQMDKRLRKEQDDQKSAHFSIAAKRRLSR